MHINAPKLVCRRIDTLRGACLIQVVPILTPINPRLQ